MLPKLDIGRIFRYSRSGISIKIGLALVASSFVLGSVGYALLEGISLYEGLYFHVITFSTVGYGELPNLSAGGRLFNLFMIVFNIAIFAYGISAFTQYIAAGGMFAKLFDIRMKTLIGNLDNHVIICGFGRYGRKCMEHFDHIQTDYVIIERNEDSMRMLIEAKRHFKYVIGDATEDRALLEAGVTRAKALILALPDDTENLFAVLSAKQLNPRIKIISRVNNERSQSKLLLAGADHVIMPEQIGGFYMATLLDKPGTIEFFSYISKETETDVDFEEIEYFELKEEYKNKTLLDLDIRKKTGANVLGVRNIDGGIKINPDPSVRFDRQSIFIVLGTKAQIRDLKALYYKEEYQK